MLLRQLIAEAACYLWREFFFLFPGVHFICPDRLSVVAYRIARFRAAARVWCALTAQFLLHLRHVLVEYSALVRGLWC